MYKKIIELLYDTDKLIDIGHEGLASQSSTSKWSKENDAQRAVKNISDASYNFHTEKEKNPWWKIEFENPKSIKYIIINNRRTKPYDKIAHNLIVLGINEDCQEILMHQGSLSFGSLPNSMPLILPLDSSILYKEIKIILQGINYLHLSSINILSEMSLQQEANKIIFFANRLDGFGERLRAILNIISLSNKYNGDFYFSWQVMGDEHKAFHAIDKHNEVFEDSFSEKHIRNFKKIRSLNLLPFKKDDCLNFNNVSCYDGILVDREYLEKKRGFDYKTAFSEIKFSNKMLKAKKSAEKILLKGKTVALHFRAGDIVYGVYRFNNVFYTKVTPPYVIESLVKIFQNKGYEVLIFSQDYEFCKAVCEKYDLLFLHDIDERNAGEAESALFDITLMSRCNCIVAGSSGFAIVASWLNEDINLISYTDILSKSEIKEAFNLSLRKSSIINNININPLLKSFSLSHFYNEFQRDIEINNSVSMLYECVNIDSDNTFYKLLLSIALYRKGSFEVADEILLTELDKGEANNRNNLYSIIKKVHKNFLKKDISLFKDMAFKGSVVASTMALLYEKELSSDLDLKFYENNSKEFKDEDLGLSIFYKELNAIRKSDF